MNTELLNYPKCRIVFEGGKPKSDAQVRCAKDLDSIATDLFGEVINHHEECYCIYLNPLNYIVGVMKVSQGGINETIVDAKIVMQGALLANAASVILMHNHPSGIADPSKADRDTSKCLTGACNLLEMRFLDSIIVTDSKMYSVSENDFHEINCHSTTLNDPMAPYGNEY